MHRFGMDDDSTATMLRELASRGLPDFTLAYFADNDYQSHNVGPHKALPVIERVDEALGRMFAAAGGADRFLRDTCVIVTSDHGHCEILAEESRAVIRLDRLLSRYRQADIGRGWQRSDEIMICPNMRAAQLYLRDTSPAMIERVVKHLLVDSPHRSGVTERSVWGRRGQEISGDEPTGPPGILARFGWAETFPGRVRDLNGRGVERTLRFSLTSSPVSWSPRSTPTLLRGSPGRSTRPIAAMCGPPRYLAVSLSSPAESRTSAVGHTARFTPSILSAPS